MASLSQSTVQWQNNMMSNVSSSVDAPNNSSDDALDNYINTNVVDEEGTTTLDSHIYKIFRNRFVVLIIIRRMTLDIGYPMLSTTKKSKDGTVRLRYVLCSRSGKPNCQNVDSMLLKSSSKLPRSSNYKFSDCKAKIKVKVFKGYPGLRLYEFVESHNHPLVSIENMDLTRKRRQLEFSDQDFIHRLSLAKVGPSTAFKMQAVLKGGQHNVRDEVMKCNYRVFGEVLAFDATYCTNQYNMIFVPFTGVDHHKNCVTFAAALLYDETIESFTWMLEQFLEAHVKQPRLVLTDQDPAMKQAIAKVFNESVHRLCMWHIMDKLPHKIDGDVLQNTNLRRHKWLSDMFSIRDQWVPVYVVF
ncbi:protein FAR1-RELATED SEQUENCE 5-like [Helianthus annuus]|uniref:protein FAR1-RELATED SEQUENCE 5-like n=1 Tax=Helianthus annuus TaxID=4232 RepID=UPI000B8F4CDC|nr:protein FAR1-RELATED SEQUENCE 5-like [Helianthus annuus]